MTTNHPRSFSARVLLAAAAIWLFSVTFCFTRLTVEPPPDAHAHACAHADQHAGTSEHAHSGPNDASCACQSFNSFPAQGADVFSVTAPADSVLLYCLAPADAFADHLRVLVVEAVDTGPPGRLSPADLVLQQCLLDHAPPFVV